MTNVAPGGPGIVGKAALDQEPATWWLPVTLGLVTMVFGLGVLVWPRAVLMSVAALVGAWLVVGGLLRIVGAFLPRGPLRRRTLSGAVGVLYIVTGVVCLSDMATSLDVLAVIVGLAWLLSAAADVAAGTARQGAPRGWLLTLGAISAAVGLVFLASPASSLRVLVLLIGLGAIVVGSIQVVAGLQIRRGGAPGAGLGPDS